MSQKVNKIYDLFNKIILSFSYYNVCRLLYIFLRLAGTRSQKQLEMWITNKLLLIPLLALLQAILTMSIESIYRSINSSRSSNNR